MWLKQIRGFYLLKVTGSKQWKKSKTQSIPKSIENDLVEYNEYYLNVIFTLLIE